jgi:hypothetical protein
MENKDISLRVGAAPNTVGKWRRRFAEHRVAGLYDEPRPGAPRQIGDDDVAEVVRQTLETTPRDATHWSLRSMAKAAGFARIDDSSDLEGLQSSAPSHRNVQAVHRPAPWNPCSRLWTRRPARSSGVVIHVIADASS